MEELKILIDDIWTEVENYYNENGTIFIGQDKIDRLKELGNE